MARRRRPRHDTRILGRHQRRQAQRAARQRTEQLYAKALRAAPASQLYTRTEVSTRLVRKVATIVDRSKVAGVNDDGEVVSVPLVVWVQQRIEASYIQPGRPVEWPVRTALIVFLLAAHLKQDFLVKQQLHLLDGLSGRVRAHLGLDYRRRNGEITSVTYTQLTDAIHRIARCFDAWGDGLTDTTRRVRQRDLQTFVQALLDGSIDPAVAWSGNVAIDATLKWTHERPPRSSGKIARRGKDGDAGPPPALSEITDGDESVFERLDPALFTPPPARTGRRRPRTWGGGNAWVGNKNIRKTLYGVALHTATNADVDGPAVVRSMIITPAVGDPVEAATFMLDTFNQTRRLAGELPAVEAVGDPAYTTRRGLTELRRLRINPTFRLHATNQAGPRMITPAKQRGARADVLLVDGWPTCTCCDHDLQHLAMPTFPATTRQIWSYRMQIAKREPYIYLPNGAYRADGSRQFLAPHRGTHPGDHQSGGCRRCCNPDGSPVIDPITKLPRQRCCTKPSVLLTADELVVSHDVPYASPVWWPRWHIRNRVEGTYGILKNLALVNWHRDYHRYVGIARETLIATFAVVAYNTHLQATWRARGGADADADDDGGPRVPDCDEWFDTNTIFGSDDPVVRPPQARAPSPPPGRKTAKKRRAPMLDRLGV